MWRIKNRLFGWLEGLWLVKDKTCCACENFVWFHGSAGVCDAKDNRLCSHMRDCMSTCDCGCFKKKRHK